MYVQISIAFIQVNELMFQYLQAMIYSILTMSLIVYVWDARSCEYYLNKQGWHRRRG